MVFDSVPVEPHFPKSTKFMEDFDGFLELARQNTIIPGQYCFLPEPTIPAHSRNQAGIQNGNNLTAYTLLCITFFFCKYFIMAIQSNQSIPHHIIVIALCPEPADEAMRHAGITW
jgi:hypothetical protein